MALSLEVVNCFQYFFAVRGPMAAADRSVCSQPASVTDMFAKISILLSSRALFF